MMRVFPLTFLLVAVMTATVRAQDWAEKMFDARSYDFGTIARGAKAEIAFELTNLYLEDVHIASVRSTCGCTTPRITKDALKTYEKGAIVAHINSDRFLAHQSATLTVTFDKPRHAQVQLHVKVYVYNDVLLEPSSIALGSVGQGNPVERTIRVQYTGRSDWRILEVRSDNAHLTGTIVETARQDGRIAYDLKAALDKDAPTGYVSEHLWLITNDPQTKQIPVLVAGQVQAEISVSPSSLFLGVLSPGQTVTKQIVVRGQKPFHIDSIRVDCQCLQTSSVKGEEAKSLYVVPITFTAGEKTGKITQTVRIETDSGQAVVEVPAHAVVQSP